MGNKTVIIGAWHRHVEIIIPWYEPLVSHGSYHSATADSIAQTVLTAHFVKCEQYSEYLLMKCFYIVVGHDDMTVSVLIPAEIRRRSTVF